MATTRYHARQTATESGTDGSGIRDLLTTAGTGSFDTQNVNDTAFAETQRFINNGGILFLNGSATWAGQINVTALGGTIEGRFRFQRRNSSGVVQSSSAYSATFSTTGIKTLSTTWNPGTWAAGDRLAISVEIRRTGGHGNVFITLGTAGSSYVDAQMAPVVGSARQLNFRTRTADTVGINSTTFAAALNTNPASVDVFGGDVVIRQRFEIDEINSTALSVAYQLRVSKNSGAYDVPASISGVTSVNSSQFTDGAATTNILAGSAKGFVAGEGVGSDNVTGTIAINNQHTEIEFTIRLDSALLADGDTLDFRVYRSTGVALTGGYTNTPRITISKVAVVTMSLTDWRFRTHDNFTEAVNSATFGLGNKVDGDFDASRGFRLRTLLAETGGGTFNDTLKLQWRKNAEAFADVAVNTPGDASAKTATSPVEIRQYTTPSVDGTATTQLLGAGSFVAGQIKDNGITTAAVALTSQETEHEWVLWFHRYSTAGVENFIDGDVIEFRLVDGSANVIAPSTSNPVFNVVYPTGYIGGQVSENPTNKMAPIVDANGHRYAFHEYAETAPAWFMSKSVTGTSWAPVDIGNGPSITDLEGADAFLANGGTEIWIFHHPGDDPRMYRFATSTHATTPDTWLDATGEQIDSAILDVIDQSIAAGLFADGSAIAIYSGDINATASNQRCYFNIRSTGGVWGTPQLLWDATTTEEYGHGVTGVMVNDVFYAVINEDSVGILQGKRITSAGALQDWAGTSVSATAAGTTIDSNVRDGVRGRQAWIGPVATGTDSLAIGGIDRTTEDGFIRHVTGLGGTLVVGARGADINPDGVMQSGIGNSRQVQAAIVRASNGDLCIVYAKGTVVEDTTSTLHYRISTDNGVTWGAENNITTATTPARGWGERIEAVTATIDSSDTMHVYYQDSSLAQADDYNSSGTVGGVATGFGWYLSIDLGTNEVTGTGAIVEQSDIVTGTGTVPISGTGAIAEASDSVTGTGTVEVTGTAAIAEASDTHAASGTVENTPIDGSGAITEQPDTHSATGTISTDGSAAILETSDSHSATGGVEVSGTGSIAEAPDSIAATGSVEISGTASIAEQTDLHAASGSSASTGTGAIVESPDTVAGVGGVEVSGTGATAELTDTVTGAGTVEISGTAAILEQPDVHFASGAAAVTGNAAITEASDVHTASGTVETNAVTGDIAITESADTHAATGNISTSGTGAIVEAPDTHTASGTLEVSGTAAITEVSDSVAGTGSIPINGSGAILESSDAHAATSSTEVTGTGAILESPDTHVAAGNVEITGSISIIETGDSHVSTGGISTDGSGAITEAPDAHASIGSVEINGTGAIVEQSDIHVATSSAVANGSGAIVESPDIHAATGNLPIGITGAILEQSDTVSGTGNIEITGAGSIVESADTASGSGSVEISGTGAIVESADIHSASGTKTTDGSANIVESGDSISGTGSVHVSGTGAVLELPDTGSGTGDIEVSGVGAVLEAPDTGSGLGGLEVTGAGSVIESPDTGFGRGDNGIITDILHRRRNVRGVRTPVLVLRSIENDE